MKYLLLLFCLFASLCYKGQIPEQTKGTDRMAAAELRQQMIDDSPLKGISFRSVGPTVMSGRVVDIDVNPLDPTHFFVAYASGGLWETRNNGQSFQPLFDHEAVMTIGDIAVYWADTSIWVGTGEVNSSRSSYAGLGVYHSSDKGESWEHLGLLETHHIGRIVLHPEDPQVAWVASLGPLYTQQGEQGVFHTHDGGKTWTHSLDTGVGAVDLVIHPNNPDRLYASLWERSRKAWNFKGNGSGSGVYESLDGGHTWKHMTGATSGFTQGEGVGRIGLSITTQSDETFLYAILDNQDRRPNEEETGEEDVMTKSEFKGMSKEAFLLLSEERVSAYLKENNFPEKYSYAYIHDQISSDELEPEALFTYLADANTDLFDTPVIGPEVFRFDTENSKWAKTHEGYLDDVVYSYGYYFGLIHVRAGHGNQLYIGGVPLLFSQDGGTNWKSIHPVNVHADHHVIWASPYKDGHLINGNDGGINISYDNGEHYVNCNSPAVGQFYTVAVDNAEPYRIYGGLQDNGVWRGPSYYEASDNWHQNGDYPYEMLMGGDGMQVAIDPADNETVYTGYQFGHYYRIREDEKPMHIHPSHELGESPLRWNWQTPIHMSLHNPDVIYMGSNRLHRSLDRGEHWEPISEDLTKGGIKGNVPFGTITSIDESPLEFGRLIAGTDDGNVYLNTGYGGKWQSILASAPGAFPDGYWVSRVEASHHEKERYYITLNGYRNDDTRAMVYRSDDNGKSWKSLGSSLPQEAVNVILEDPVDEDILYVGTDHGLYLSQDGGETFSALMEGLPQVPIHDMVMQEREQELVIGTHGRSIYVADVSMLYSLPEISESLHLFPLDSMQGSDRWGGSGWSRWFGSNEPSLDIYWTEDMDEPCVIQVRDEKKHMYFEEIITSGNGLQKYAYDLSADTDLLAKSLKKKKSAPELKPADNGVVYLGEGSYEVLLTCGSEQVKQSLIIR
jgi:photosystem II stability/assembly factor-like uncharacterized protein